MSEDSAPIHPIRILVDHVIPTWNSFWELHHEQYGLYDFVEFGKSHNREGEIVTPVFTECVDAFVNHCCRISTNVDGTINSCKHSLKA